MYVNGSNIYAGPNEVHDTGLWWCLDWRPGVCPSGEFSYLEHTFYITGSRTNTPRKRRQPITFSGTTCTTTLPIAVSTSSSRMKAGQVFRHHYHHHVDHNGVVNQVSDALQFSRAMMRTGYRQSVYKCRTARMLWAH